MTSINPINEIKLIVSPFIKSTGIGLNIGSIVKSKEHSTLSISWQPDAYKIFAIPYWNTDNTITQKMTFTLKTKFVSLNRNGRHTTNEIILDKYSPSNCLTDLSEKIIICPAKEIPDNIAKILPSVFVGSKSPANDKKQPKNTNIIIEISFILVFRELKIME